MVSFSWMCSLEWTKQSPGVDFLGLQVDDFKLICAFYFPLSALLPSDGLYFWKEVTEM